MDAPSSPGVDPFQQLLLAQLAGDPVSMGPSMEDLLAQQPADPMTAAVFDALRRRRERDAIAAQEEISNEGNNLDDVEEEQPEGVGSDPGVADILRRLYDEVAALRTRNQILADALGACAMCWGEIADCPMCRGRGSPGGRTPIEREFAKYVSPAVERRRVRRADEKSTRMPPESSNVLPVEEPVSLN